VFKQIVLTHNKEANMPAMAVNNTTIR